MSDSNIKISGRIQTNWFAVYFALLLAACGGGGGGQSSSPSAAAMNTIPIVVDAGPVPGGKQINIPYVSVTVCQPGTSTCQTIDHIQLDTGSFGLRIVSSALGLANLPPVTNSGGQPMGECVSFAIGTTWGSLRRADVRLGGELASSIPFQVIGEQPGGGSLSVPTDCSGTGTIQTTQAALGANGILGVGLFAGDCDLCTTQVVPATYYACPASGCTNSMVTPAQMVTNPVVFFLQDNNGVLVKLPAPPSSGATTLNGSLLFGIGTQPNNAVSSAQVYPASSSGNFSTLYNGASSSSFIDSGSNGFFFTDSSIAMCSMNTQWYCPTPSPLNLTAINTASGGVPSGTVNFSLGGVDALGSTITAANIGAPGISGYFDWGLPFFFGRPVFVAIAGATTPQGVGPYWAY